MASACGFWVYHMQRLFETPKGTSPDVSTLAQLRLSFQNNRALLLNPNRASSQPQTVSALPHSACATSYPEFAVHHHEDVHVAGWRRSLLDICWERTCESFADTQRAGSSLECCMWAARIVFTCRLKLFFEEGQVAGILLPNTTSQREHLVCILPSIIQISFFPFLNGVKCASLSPFLHRPSCICT